MVAIAIGSASVVIMGLVGAMYRDNYRYRYWLHRIENNIAEVVVGLITAIIIFVVFIEIRAKFRDREDR